MITNINIASTADEVTLEFDFQTPQIFSYKVQITDQDGNVSFDEDGIWNGRTSFDLGPGQDLTGLFLTIFWNEIDPAGAGANFAASATAFQNSTACEVVQVFKGVSTNDPTLNNTIAKFV